MGQYVIAYDDFVICISAVFMTLKSRLRK